MAGKDIYPNDKGVLNLNDMYTTTNQATHRKFKERELKGYPEKNVPTYWECEEYPKVWGHGLHEKYEIINILREVIVTVSTAHKLSSLLLM